MLFVWEVRHMLEKQDIQTIAEIFHSSMNPIKEELQNVKGEVLGLKEQVQDVQSEVQEVKEQVQGVEGEVRELKEQVHGVEGKARELEGHVQGIRLTLENETNKNINIVAEGHLNLSRKLDEALKVENEKEMLLIRVNRLENGYRTLQEQVESIAQG